MIRKKRKYLIIHWKRIKKNDDLIMITSGLVKEYDENSDGYALIVEKRPSLTPLNVNMTYQDLKDW